ncbi:hypothetical protein SAMD00019534_005090, partial [Acytostelium subglobosum LB1]|uniref:hypothetical protein n=1 Tax=Acytostelium subglobosum LB1 TaxID=1410327 RepID=UPI000644B348
MNSNKAMLAQHAFRKIYNQLYGKNDGRWEYVVLRRPVYQWLADHDAPYVRSSQPEKLTEAINEIFDIILSILEMLRCSPSLLSTIVYYSNKFVARTGLKHNQLFNLLLTSTIVTIKFWSESAPINNKMLSDIFEFPVQDINLMEQRFLSGIEYELCINEDQIDSFMSNVEKALNTGPSSTKLLLVSTSSSSSDDATVPSTSSSACSTSISSTSTSLSSSSSSSASSSIHCMESQTVFSNHLSPTTAI